MLLLALSPPQTGHAACSLTHRILTKRCLLILFALLRTPALSQQLKPCRYRNARGFRPVKPRLRFGEVLHWYKGHPAVVTIVPVEKGIPWLPHLQCVSSDCNRGTVTLLGARARGVRFHKKDGACAVMSCSAPGRR